MIVYRIKKRVLTPWDNGFEIHKAKRETGGVKDLTRGDGPGPKGMIAHGWQSVFLGKVKMGFNVEFSFLFKKKERN